MALTMSVQYLGFRRLYKSELLSDVVISFGDEKVPAHKVILMGASRKLQALLQDQSVSAPTNLRWYMPCLDGCTDTLGPDI